MRLLIFVKCDRNMSSDIEQSRDSELFTIPKILTKSKKKFGFTVHKNFSFINFEDSSTLLPCLPID